MCELSCLVQEYHILKHFDLGYTSLALFRQFHNVMFEKAMRHFNANSLLFIYVYFIYWVLIKEGEEKDQDILQSLINQKNFFVEYPIFSKVSFIFVCTCNIFFKLISLFKLNTENIKVWKRFIQLACIDIEFCE